MSLFNLHPNDEPEVGPRRIPFGRPMDTTYYTGREPQPGRVYGPSPSFRVEYDPEGYRRYAPPLTPEQERLLNEAPPVPSAEDVIERGRQARRYRPRHVRDPR